MELFTLLLSAGGAAFLVAVFNGVKSLRSSKGESEEALFSRLNEDAEQAHQDADTQRERAINAEQQSDTLRNQRDEALDTVAKLRRLLIEHNIEIPKELQR